MGWGCCNFFPAAPASFLGLPKEVCGGAALLGQLLVMQSLILEVFLGGGELQESLWFELCWVWAVPRLLSAVPPMTVLSCLPGT